jgi:hypothetical protein
VPRDSPAKENVTTLPQTGAVFNQISRPAGSIVAALAGRDILLLDLLGDRA